MRRLRVAARAASHDPAVQEARRPRRAACGRATASRARRACRSGSRARRRGSRGTWPPCARLELGALGLERARRSRGRAAQRAGDEQHGARRRRAGSERTPCARPGRCSGSRTSRADAGRVAGAGDARHAALGRPAGDEAAEQDDQRADPDPGHQRVDLEAGSAPAAGSARSGRSARAARARGTRSTARRVRSSAALVEEPVALVDPRPELRDVRRDRGPDVLAQARVERRPRWSTRRRRSARPGPSDVSCDGK